MGTPAVLFLTFLGQPFPDMDLSSPGISKYIKGYLQSCQASQISWLLVQAGKWQRLRVLATDLNDSHSNGAAFPVFQTGKMQENQVQSLGQEDLLEEGMAN